MTSITIEAAARELIRSIYGDPVIPEPGVTSAAPETLKERQCYRHGYYSVRDLPEFKQLAELLKEAEAKEALPPGQYVCKIVDFQIEPGQKPGDLKAMLTVDVPGLGSKLKVEAASAKVELMPSAVAKELTEYIAKNMERESALLYPHPSTIMQDPYGLLDLIRKKSGVSSEAMDFWMVEAQKGLRGGPSA